MYQNNSKSQNHNGSTKISNLISFSPGLTCKSIVNMTGTDTAAPYYRYTDGACVGILNAPRSFDCSAKTSDGAKICPCEAAKCNYSINNLVFVSQGRDGPHEQMILLYTISFSLK